MFVDTDPLGNASVLATVIAAFVAFLLFVPWAWRADLKDKYKVRTWTRGYKTFFILSSAENNAAPKKIFGTDVFIRAAYFLFNLLQFDIFTK